MALNPVGAVERAADALQSGPFGGHLAERRVGFGHEGRTAVGGEVVVELALAAAHPLGTAEAVEVGPADVGDEPVVGLGNRGQQGDFAAGARPHLHHAELRRGIHRQQRQRHADVVVQIALRGAEHEALGEHAGDELLGRRLAVAACDGQDWNGQCAAVFAGQRLERREHVVDEDAPLAGCRRVVDNGPHGPLFEGLGGKAVAVERSALQGEEERVGQYPPRVGRDVRMLPVDGVEFLNVHVLSLFESVLGGRGRACRAGLLSPIVQKTRTGAAVRVPLGSAAVRCAGRRCGTSPRR